MALYSLYLTEIICNKHSDDLNEDVNGPVARQISCTETVILYSSPPDLLQQFHVIFMFGTQELGVVLQVGSHRVEQRGRITSLHLQAKPLWMQL